MERRTELQPSGLPYPTPLNPQDPQQWDTAPQTVRTQGEQDTAKYVYEPGPGIKASLVDEEAKSNQQQRICGNSALVFCIMLALVAIAIAGAVGGGVGGGMAAKNCRKELTALRQSVPSSTQITNTQTANTQTTNEPTRTSTLSTTSSSTSSATAAPSTITVPETGCPSVNGTIYTSKFGDKSTNFDV